MSTVLVLTPIIISNWHAITAVVSAAVGTMGFSMAQQAGLLESQAAGVTREEIEVDNTEILASAAGRGEEIVVEREGLRARFTRD